MKVFGVCVCTEWGLYSGFFGSCYSGCINIVFFFLGKIGFKKVSVCLRLYF